MDAVAMNALQVLTYNRNGTTTTDSCVMWQAASTADTAASSTLLHPVDSEMHQGQSSILLFWGQNIKRCGVKFC